MNLNKWNFAKIACLTAMSTFLGSIALFATFSQSDEVKGAPTTPSQANAPISPLPVIAMGSPDARVKVIMYHALNCPHCKEFKTHMFPEFKKKYIDSGLIHFEMRDFPIDAVSMAASKLAWCKEKSPESYLKYADLIIKNFKIDEKQKVELDWAAAGSQLDAVQNLGKLLEKHGLSPAECRECLTEKTPTENAILQSCLDVQRNYPQLDYAPGFLVNGKLIELPDLEKQIDLAIEMHKTK